MSSLHSLFVFFPFKIYLFSVLFYCIDRKKIFHLFFPSHFLFTILTFFSVKLKMFILKNPINFLNYFEKDTKCCCVVRTMKKTDLFHTKKNHKQKPLKSWKRKLMGGQWIIKMKCIFFLIQSFRERVSMKHDWCAVNNEI